VLVVYGPLNRGSSSPPPLQSNFTLDFRSIYFDIETEQASKKIRSVLIFKRMCDVATEGLSDLLVVAPKVRLTGVVVWVP
jgi:hypothetical protein